jgi:hypothetical protein
MTPKKLGCVLLELCWIKSVYFIITVNCSS